MYPTVHALNAQMRHKKIKQKSLAVSEHWFPTICATNAFCNTSRISKITILFSKSWNKESSVPLNQDTLSFKRFLHFLVVLWCTCAVGQNSHSCNIVIKLNITFVIVKEEVAIKTLQFQSDTNPYNNSFFLSPDLVSKSCLRERLIWQGQVFL